MRWQKLYRGGRNTVTTALLIVVAGCGSDERLPVYPVQGQVFVEKKPAAGAVVWLIPESDQPAKNRRVPVGRADADGRFEIETYGEKDGAPAGKYRMTVMWRGPAKTGDEDGPNLISPRYMDPAKSGLPIVEIRPGQNTIPPVHLSRN